MKSVWVKIIPWDKKLATTAIENGADALMVEPSDTEKVRELSRMAVISDNGDLVPGRDVIEIEVTSQDDEPAVVAAAAKGRVIVHTPDWTIIPLENLIARKAEVVVPVADFDGAQMAAGVLEHGVWGILTETRDPLELKRILTTLKSGDEDAALVPAEIVNVKPVGMGDRVCVDTCTNMGLGQGMLVGNSSKALFLVHAESVENPYVAPRPFRVNAGAVHAYTRIPGGKTRYLSELKSGDAVLVSDYTGKSEPAAVGRVKIEKRPLLLVTARAGEKEFSVVLQNAETIRLTDTAGKPVSVVKLNPGDKVLAALEEGGRHFGMKIEETILEK
ncbi:MAG: 3-dehydroquinate synthase II [Deltaproteobacteria bacterium]|nr:3-dehydroquinate synthase II [Deltaproteobacteria bacterium]